jgi:hypothetical protein
LHSGKGINRGRMTHTAQYVTPKIAGAYLVANTTFSGSNDETFGIGARWSNKNIMAYLDWIDYQQALKSDVTTPTKYTDILSAIHDCTLDNNCDKGSAIKVGGKFSADAFDVALQYETIDTGEWQNDTDYIFAAGTFNIDKNNQVMLTYGTASYDVDNMDTTGIAVAYNHKLSKMTNMYLGYGAKSSDADKADESMFTAGIRKKF